MKFGLLLLFLTFSYSAWASPAEEPVETRIPLLEAIDDLVGNRVNNVANNFDSFFATERADDELGRSRLRIRSSYLVQERALPNDDIQVRFNLRLPYLEQRFRYEMEDNAKEKKAKSAVEKAKIQQSRAKRQELDERWLFHGDTGVNVSLKPRALVRGRVRKSKQTGTLIHRFVHEVSFATDRDGFRQRTQLDSDHTFSPDLLFRFTNLVDWRISAKDFGTTHGPGLFQRISDYEAISYGLTMSTIVIHGIWFVNNFSLAPTYRRNLYKDMVYGSVTPGINFPKEWSFRRTPFVLVQLEFLFGS